MKVKYKTNYETACILKEMAGNIGSSLRNLNDAGMARVSDHLQETRGGSVESFMAGEVEAGEPTSEGVLKSFEIGRRWREKTIKRLAPTISIQN
ncbi:MAG: hypothetical protein H8E27_01685 [Verrucomicrobia subdivision 3 bacterium]|nr:hypothetical protein [Limisphaerales bacterium]